MATSRDARGVGLLLTPEATKLWKADGKWETGPTDDTGRWMYATFPIQRQKGKRGRRLAVFSVYAPTNTAQDKNTDAKTKSKMKDKFWENLSEAIMGIPKHWPLIILGDFNSRVSNVNDCTTEASATPGYNNRTQVNPAVLGEHNLPDRNDNGDRLLTMCECLNLCVANTFTSRQQGQTYSFTYRKNKQKVVIDHVLVRQ